MGDCLGLAVQLCTLPWLGPGCGGQAGTRTGKPLLTFRQIAAAIGAESEQAAQGRYRRKVANLNNSDSGNNGTPDHQPEPGGPQTAGDAEPTVPYLPDLPGDDMAVPAARAAW